MQDTEEILSARETETLTIEEQKTFGDNKRGQFVVVAVITGFIFKREQYLAKTYFIRISCRIRFVVFFFVLISSHREKTF